MRKLFVFVALVLGSACSSPKEIDKVAIPEEEILTKPFNKFNVAWTHLIHLDSIAKANNGHRSTASPGGIATKDYIIASLTKLGYTPITKEFMTPSGKLATNILVEIPGKTYLVQMLGTHYDSVPQGPGINDNGTGVAILLSYLQQLKQVEMTPAHSLTLAFWDAEEEGILGSLNYVKNLNETEKRCIRYYINVDMVGTKAPTMLLLDSDGSSYETMKKRFIAAGLPEDEANLQIEAISANLPKQLPTSVELENMMRVFFESKQLKITDDYITSLQSDVLPFIGITAVTGLVFTKEEVTEKNELLFAPCYHQACDDITNVDSTSFKTAIEATFYIMNKLNFPNRKKKGEY